MRRDLADVFCTSADGVRAERARDWRLVDYIAKPADFQKVVRERADALAAESDRPADAKGVALTPLAKQTTDSGWRYSSLAVHIDQVARTARSPCRPPTGTLLMTCPASLPRGRRGGRCVLPASSTTPSFCCAPITPISACGCSNHPARRTNGLEAGSIMLRHRDYWLVRETIALWRRTLQRLDVFLAKSVRGDRGRLVLRGLFF